MSPTRIALVADDLTGATDAAVEFARCGYPAYVLRRPGAEDALPLTGPAVLAVSTGVRALDAERARDLTAAAVTRLVGVGADALYVKVDSVGRGSLAGQVAGALGAWSDVHPGAYAVLCPALPAHGRTVRGGVVLVDDQPTEQTPAGHDPVTPVVDSRLEHLVPGAVLVDADGVGAADGPHIRVADAASEGDLREIGRRIDACGPRAVAVGSSGLAAALAGLWADSLPHPSALPTRMTSQVLVAVSSLHPTAQAQLSALRRADHGGTPGTVRIVQTRQDALAPDEAAGLLAADVLTAWREQPADVLVLVGGDGASAVVDALEAVAIEVHPSPWPGTAYGVLIGGGADGARVVTKSGGFGDDQSLVAIIDRLSSGPAPEKEAS